MNIPSHTSCAGCGSGVENPKFLEFSVGNASFKMVYVEGGKFIIKGNRDREEQRVDIDDFYIAETEVTQELWQAVMGSNPSKFRGDNNPVEFVSWNDCQVFIQRLNSITQYNFRLPLEKEWEYAANGGAKSHHFKYSGSNNVNDVAWYEGNSNLCTHEVATKLPNELGLYDMSGNVCEWCVSLNDKGDLSTPTNRGGSWYEGELRTRCDLDYCWGFTRAMNVIGLRLAATKL